MLELDSTSVTTESSGLDGEGKDFMSAEGEGGACTKGEGELRETNMVVMKEVMVAAATTNFGFLCCCRLPLRPRDPFPTAARCPKL